MPGLTISFEPVPVWERTEQTRFMLIQKVKRESELQKQLPSERRVQGFCSFFVDLCDSKHFQSSSGNFLICGFLDLSVPKRASCDLYDRYPLAPPGESGKKIS